MAEAINAPAVPGMKTIRPTWANHDDVVEIHWRCPEGIFIERRSCPPKSTRETQANEKSVKSEIVQSILGV